MSVWVTHVHIGSSEPQAGDLCIFCIIYFYFSDQEGCQHQHVSPETHEHYVVEVDMESKVNAQSCLHLKQLGDENNAFTRTRFPEFLMYS